jgi:hypothetical protein
MPPIEPLTLRVQNGSENITRPIMDWIIVFRGIEMDEEVGDLDLQKCSS